MAHRHFLVSTDVLVSPDETTEVTLVHRFGKVICIHVKDENGARAITTSEALFLMRAKGVPKDD